MELQSDEGSRLADAIEARAAADMYAAAPAALEIRTEVVGGATVLLAPRIPVSYFNRAIGLGVDEPASESSLDEIIAKFASARVADYWLHLNPIARPRELPDWLAARAFATPPRRTWAKFLRGTQRYDTRPSAFRIRRADARDAPAVAQTACSAFGLPALLAPWFAALVGRPGWNFVVAETDTGVAATGAVFIAGTTAWVGVGATLADQRNRGAQSALLAARIAVAADAGCTVLATETGESISGEKNPSLENIRRAGFEQVCSRLNLAPKR